MMTATLVFWLIAGLAMGIGHAWLLWKSSQPPFRWAAAGPLRMLPLAAGFVAAAVLGGLIPFALGWLAAFAASVTTIALRKSP